MLPTDYIELIKYFPPTAIVSGHQLKQAHSIMDELIDCEDLTQGQQDYLYLLALVVEDYESKMEPLPDAPPDEVIQHLLETQGKILDDLLPIFNGDTHKMKGVVNGYRQPTTIEIAELAKFFNVSPAVFFAEK